MAFWHDELSVLGAAFAIIAIIFVCVMTGLELGKAKAEADDRVERIKSCAAMEDSHTAVYAADKKGHLLQVYVCPAGGDND